LHGEEAVLLSIPGLNSYVIITKNKHPMIQFVIRHRSLCAAIENFEVTVPNTEHEMIAPE